MPHFDQQLMVIFKTLMQNYGIAFIQADYGPVVLGIAAARNEVLLELMSILVQIYEFSAQI